MVRIHVRTIDGSINLPLSQIHLASTTVHEVMNLIREYTSNNNNNNNSTIAASNNEDRKLVYINTILSDPHKTLADYDIQGEDALHLIIGADNIASLTANTTMGIFVDDNRLLGTKISGHNVAFRQAALLAKIASSSSSAPVVTVRDRLGLVTGTRHHDNKNKSNNDNNIIVTGNDTAPADFIADRLMLPPVICGGRPVPFINFNVTIHVRKTRFRCKFYPQMDDNNNGQENNNNNIVRHLSNEILLHFGLTQRHCVSRLEVQLDGDNDQEKNRVQIDRDEDFIKYPNARRVLFAEIDMIQKFDGRNPVLTIDTSRSIGRGTMTESFSCSITSSSSSPSSNDESKNTANSTSMSPSRDQQHHQIQHQRSSSPNHGSGGGATSASIGRLLLADNNSQQQPLSVSPSRGDQRQSSLSPYQQQQQLSLYTQNTTTTTASPTRNELDPVVHSYYSPSYSSSLKRTTGVTTTPGYSITSNYNNNNNNNNNNNTGSNKNMNHNSNNNNIPSPFDPTRYLAKRLFCFDPMDSGFLLDEKRRIADAHEDSLQKLNSLQPHPNLLFPIGRVCQEVRQRFRGVERSIGEVTVYLIYPRYEMSLHGFLTRVGSELFLPMGLAIVRRVIYGLRHLHKFDTVHGSLTPKNVLVQFVDATNSDIISLSTIEEINNNADRQQNSAVKKMNCLPPFDTLDIRLTDWYQPELLAQHGAGYSEQQQQQQQQGKGDGDAATSAATMTLNYTAPELRPIGEPLNQTSSKHPTKESDLWQLGVMCLQIFDIIEPGQNQCSRIQKFVVEDAKDFCYVAPTKAQLAKAGVKTNGGSVVSLNNTPSASGMVHHQSVVERKNDSEEDDDDFRDGGERFRHESCHVLLNLAEGLLRFEPSKREIRLY